MDNIDYFRTGNPFLWAHATVWFCALYLFWGLLRELRRLREHALPLRAITEPEIRKFLYPVEKFDSYFDLCSSCFILIGLIGTIVGFFRALPLLNSPQYDFHNFQQALANSGFGIIWSILLSVGVAAHHRYFIAPVIERVQDKVSVDQLAQSLAQALDKFGGQITANLSVGLTHFSSGATQVAAAASRLSEAAQSAGKSFSASTQQVAEAARKVDEVLQRTVKIPEETALGLARTYDQLMAFQNKSLAEQKQTLETLVENSRAAMTKDVALISGKYQEVTEGLVKRQAAALESGYEGFDGTLAEVRKNFESTLAAENRLLVEALSAAAGEVASLVKKVEHNMQKAHDPVIEKIKASQAEAVETMRAAATAMSGAVTQQANQMKLATTSIQALSGVLDRLIYAVQVLAETTKSSSNRMAALEAKFTTISAEPKKPAAATGPRRFFSRWFRGRP
jgi:hypothetical protein